MPPKVKLVYITLKHLCEHKTQANHLFVILSTKYDNKKKKFNVLKIILYWAPKNFYESFNSCLISWLIKLYRFQWYNSIINYLYIVFCVHHPSKVSFGHHLSTLYPLLPLPTHLPFVNHHTVISV